MSYLRAIADKDVWQPTLSVLALALFVNGCVSPVSKPTPVSAAPSVDVFSQALSAMDGSTVELNVKPCEIAFSGLSLVLPGKTTACITKEGESLRVEFGKPCPRGKATRFGFNFSAGIETVVIERERISAFTETLGKKFVWELRETP